MKKRIQQFLESVLFAGLKPGRQSAPKQEPGPVRSYVDRFLSGGQPTDPLYLTNRTSGQKLKSWSLVAIPCLVLAVGVTLSTPMVAHQGLQALQSDPKQWVMPNGNYASGAWRRTT